MNWKAIGIIGLSCLLGMAGLTLAEEANGERLWFGLGGSSLGLAFPDFSAVDAYLFDNGYVSVGDAFLFTGGWIRGGSLPGLSLGAIGWSGAAMTVSGTKYAELSVGFGGVEIGRVIGGDDRSLLSLGVVLGGGGTSLTLSGSAGGASAAGGRFGLQGIEPGPSILSRQSAFFTIEPYVSLQVQPLHYFGFELNLGYMLSLLSFDWGDPEMEGVFPRMSGPVVGLSATWGVIGRPVFGPIADRPALEETVDQTVSLAGPCVEIENALGSITVETYGGEGSSVRIGAVKRAHTQAILDRVSILIEPTRCGLTIRSTGPRTGYWEIDYTVAVPPGVELSLEQAAGSIRLNGVSAAASIDLGIGEIEIEGIDGPSLLLQSGAGDVRISGVEAEMVEVNLGTGDIEILLPVDASYATTAIAGIGEISIGPFPELEALEAGGLGGRVETVLGSGSGDLTIMLGVGEIDIRPAP